MTSCTSVDAEFIFRLFSKCPEDPATLVLDTRAYKLFKRSHVILSYSVRLSANAKALVDYSKAQYKQRWSQGIWWGKNVLLYGEPGMKKSHPVIGFLLEEAQCKSISYYREGFDQFEGQYSFLCSSSVKLRSVNSYPSQIVPKLLYLGDLQHANDHDRLKELNINSIVTIHNHPERTSFPAEYEHLRIELPDIETADISQHFNSVYECIEKARSRGKAVLVHCGAGVSRSPTLCVAYLMRKNLWSLETAHNHCKERRSKTNINAGFWKALSSLEVKLCITDRLDPEIAANSSSRIRKISKDAAGSKVNVVFCKLTSGASIEDIEKKGTSCLDFSSKTKRRKRSESNSERNSPSAKRHRTHTSTTVREHPSSDHGGSSQPVSEASDSQVKFAQEKRNGPTMPKVACVKLEVSKGGSVKGVLEIQDLGQFGRCIIGRADACDIVLQHESVSRQHAQLEYVEGGRLVIVDLGSGHGTNANGTWLRPRVPRTLRIGSVLRFGASTRSYKVTSVG